MRIGYVLTVAALAAAALALSVTEAQSQAAPAAGPYKVVKTLRMGGAGRLDYVYADAEGRKLYVPRNNGADSNIMVFDLDELTTAGTIKSTGVRGVAVDAKSGHGFCSSNPVVMWDTKTLKTLKTIPVEGSPDGIMFEPATERIYVLSHSAPNVTVIDGKDGSKVGTIDLGGAPEQGASDGKGKVYIDLEDKDQIAVVDANTMKTTGHYELGGKGGGPAGLAFDIKNGILFAACHEPATSVILNAADGKIITSLPIGTGVDGATFNPNTMEAFSSQGDGTLTVIKENSPTSFEVAQNVQTLPGAKTLTLDPKTNRVILITSSAPGAARGATGAPGAGGRGGARGARGARGGRGGAGVGFTILVVAK